MKNKSSARFGAPATGTSKKVSQDHLLLDDGGGGMRIAAAALFA